MNLIYHTKDINWGMIILFFVIWPLVFIPISIVTSDDTSDRYEGLEPSNTQLLNEKDFDWFDFDFFGFLIVPLFVASFAFNVQVKAYKDGIIVHLGIIKLQPYEIKKENIIAIQSSPLPAAEYFPLLRTQLYDTDRCKWRVFVMSNINPGLMIQTKQRKYIISCHDAVKAAEFLRNAYGLPDIPIEPPPTWQD